MKFYEKISLPHKMFYFIDYRGKPFHLCEYCGLADHTLDKNIKNDICTKRIN